MVPGAAGQRGLAREPADLVQRGRDRAQDPVDAAEPAGEHVRERGRGCVHGDADVAQHHRDRAQGLVADPPLVVLEAREDRVGHRAPDPGRGLALVGRGVVAIGRGDAGERGDAQQLLDRDDAQPAVARQRAAHVAGDPLADLDDPAEPREVHGAACRGDGRCGGREQERTAQRLEDDLDVLAVLGRAGIERGEQPIELVAELVAAEVGPRDRAQASIEDVARQRGARQADELDGLEARIGGAGRRAGRGRVEPGELDPREQVGPPIGDGAGQLNGRRAGWGPARRGCARARIDGVVQAHQVGLSDPALGAREVRAAVAVADGEPGERTGQRDPIEAPAAEVVVVGLRLPQPPAPRKTRLRENL